MTNKRVSGVYEAGSHHWVGDGFPVRNLFPSNGIPAQDLDPFLMLDYAGPLAFPPAAPGARPRGVGEHPHRGFETVTIVYQGSVAHRDSAGNAGVIGPGDVQWMTAASGVVHEELHEPAFAARGGTFEIVQLWVNLPAAHKMSPPGYQGIVAQDIPEVALAPGVTARIIAGEIGSTRGPARTFTPMNVIDLRLAAGSRAGLAVPAGHQGAAVLLHGGVELNGAATRLAGEAQLAHFGPGGDSLELAAQTDSTLLILTGEPIGEPIASHGPFVMNTEAEIRQAFADYRGGRMGRLA